MGNLNSDTLVLNRSWLAVQVCSVKRAISLVYQGHAKVVDENFQSYNFEDWSEVSQQMIEINDDEFIHSTSLKIRVPRVIVLLLYDKLPKGDVRFSRKNIFERDNYTCQYCGKKPPSKSQALRWMEKNQLNLDHIIPRSRGGKTVWENVVASCVQCNNKKASYTLEELGWKLKNPPTKPKWNPTITLPFSMKTHKQWVNFMDLVYWNTELEHDVEPESK